MKAKIYLLIAVCTFFTGLKAVAQSPVEYMNSFSTEYQKIQQDMWDYTSSVSHGKSARKVDKRRMELIQTSNAALSKAKAAKGFEGSTEFKDSVVEYLRIVNIVLKEDYAKIVDMEEIAENSYDAMEAYMTARDQASDKLADASVMINRVQRRFAEAHDVKIIESSSELDKKMEVAGDVYEHYNKVYLIFFKSFKQEVYLLDAIARKDLSAIEQNREALIATAKEGLEKLKEVELYNADRTVVDATKKLLEFYITEGEKDIKVVSDFMLTSENFNKTKEAFDKKPEKSRTKADVDAYNKAVNDMNAGVNQYNATNNKLNADRSKLIEGWNKTAQAFTDKHVPKGK
jgi:hypothetical protein